MQRLKCLSSASPADRAQVVAQAVAVLQAGGLVLFPTETTYGAGVDATNPTAVAKLLKYKARREGKPLSIAVTDLAMGEQFVEVNDSARRIYERFLPGPVTVVSQSRGTVAPGVESEFGTLGVRIPAYPLVLEMVAALGHPITATSANASGEKLPYTLEDVFEGLSAAQAELLDLAIDAGQLPPNPPSTVIDTTLSTPTTLRQGELQLAPELQHQTLLASDSETETKAIAKRLLLKYWDDVKTRGLVIGLDGALGMGKTIFAKGVAEFLQISETIVSPTYTYVEGYSWERHGVTGKLWHLDLWKLASADDLSRLGLAEMAGPGKVVVIEWLSQGGGFGKVETAMGQMPGQAGATGQARVASEAAKPALVQIVMEAVADQTTGRKLQIREVGDIAEGRQ